VCCALRDKKNTECNKAQRRRRHDIYSVVTDLTSYRPGGGETICPAADGGSTAAKIAADLRPSADGSAVRTSLVAGGG